MLIIEFFGPSGSGKSHFRNKIIKKNFKNFKVYDYKSINLNLKNQSYFVKFYFQLIKSNIVNKIKTSLNINHLRVNFLNFFFRNYKKTIAEKKLNKKNLKRFKVIQNLINNSSFNKKKKINFIRWSKEEMVGYQEARRNKEKNSILIDSEGLIQRLFIYCYKKKNKKKIIKEYLDNINLPEILIFFKKTIVHKKINKNIDKNEIKNTFLFTIQYLKKKKILLLDSNQGIDLLEKKN